MIQALAICLLVLLGACSRYETHHGDGTGSYAGPPPEAWSVPKRVQTIPIVPEPEVDVHPETVPTVILPTPRPKRNSPKRTVHLEVDKDCNPVELRKLVSQYGLTHVTQYLQDNKGVSVQKIQNCLNTK